MVTSCTAVQLSAVVCYFLVSPILQRLWAEDVQYQLVPPFFEKGAPCLEKRRLHFVQKGGVLWHWRKYFRCKWRISSSLITNIIKTYTCCSGYSQTYCSVVLFCRTHLHDNRTITEKNSSVVDDEASKLSCRISRQLQIIYWNLSKVGFCDTFDVMPFLVSYGTIIFSKHLGVFLCVNNGCFMFWKQWCHIIMDIFVSFEYSECCM